MTAPDAEMGPQSQALAAALARAPAATVQDGAAVELARRYAELLDAPVLPAKFRDAIDDLEALIESARENRLVRTAEEADNALYKIKVALSEHTVASDLGPKYLAALTALGMTPAGRGARLAAVPPEGEKPSANQRLREKARARAVIATAGSGGFIPPGPGQYDP